MGHLDKHDRQSALHRFKKADKQDGGHCTACQKQMVKYGTDLGDWKTAELGTEELGASAKNDREIALAHYDLAQVLMNEGLQKHKAEYFTRTHEECLKAMPASVRFPDAVLLDGRALAQLHQDDAAKERFGQYLKMKPGDDPNRQRVARYVARTCPRPHCSALCCYHEDDCYGRFAREGGAARFLGYLVRTLP
jgi:hypothetical protein